MQLPEPQCASDEVIVQVATCGICGTDRAIFRGEAPAARPVVLGHEFSGVVAEVGSQVTEVSVGDRVAVDPNVVDGTCFFCRRGETNLCSGLSPLGITRNGGFAEFAAVPATNAYRLPDSVSVEAGSLVEPLACCVRGLDQARIGLGDLVAVLGAAVLALPTVSAAAPSVNVVGDASGGIPSDLVAVANNLNGSTFAAFLLYSIIGLNQDYPSQINLSNYTNAAGVAAVNSALSDNLVQATGQFNGAKLESYTANNPATGAPWTLGQLLSVPSVASTVAAQSLGGTPITVPVYQYHAQSDEVVPLAQSVALNKTYCGEGVKVDFVTYPGDHVSTDPAAAPDVVNWINNRFNGVAAPSNC